MKDMTESHKRVLEAAKREFLKNGFEKASIRSIGKSAGMTSAGLYRYCESKENLFCQIIDPLIQDLNRFMQVHRNVYNKVVQTGTGYEDMFDTGESMIFRKLSLKYREEMKLLLCYANGTQYENFLHDFVHLQEIEMFQAIEELGKHGQKVMRISHNEMHMLISAFVTALTEPIIHDYSEEDTKKCLITISEFFTPGWKKIMGC